MRAVGSVLIVILIAGALASVTAAGGTFATFTAQTTNPANAYATGTLVLSNAVGSNTACFSTAGGTTDVNTNSSCDPMSLFAWAVRQPGDSSTVVLTLKNEGSLNAGAFTLSTSGCTPVDATGESYHGSGDPCAVLQFFLQEETAAGVPLKCWYGHSTDGMMCDFSDTTKTLAAFASTYSSGNGLNLLAAGFSFNAGTSRYFNLGVRWLPAAGNSYQGRAAVFDLTWRIES